MTSETILFITNLILGAIGLILYRMHSNLYNNLPEIRHLSGCIAIEDLFKKKYEGEIKNLKVNFENKVKLKFPDAETVSEAIYWITCDGYLDLQTSVLLDSEWFTVRERISFFNDSPITFGIKIIK